MRRILIGLVVSVAALAVLVAVASRIPAVQDRLIERIAGRTMGESRDDLFRDDALRVVLCGTSSPMPHPERAKACVLVIAGGRFWVVDTGPESWRNMALWRIPGQRVAGVLLTHFHSDHIGELGEWNFQTWVAGRPGPLPVYGPPGVERVVAGFQEAYALDTGYRIAHHGAELLPPENERMEARPVEAPPGGVVVLDEGGLRITAVAVDHRPVVPAYGYRFDYRGRSVVISGDTKKDEALAQAARGADVLVHEAQSNHIVGILEQQARAAGRNRIAKVLHDIPDYHTTPVQAAEVANEAGVKLLVFYHLTPPPPAKLVERVFLRGVDQARRGDWLLGEDGTLVELPLDSQRVVVGSVR